jgi:MoxR-like ATPase
MAANSRTILIGNKTVFQSEAFSPDTGFFRNFVGREAELRLITAAWIAGKNSLPLSPMLIGEPGVGKNRIIYELAQKTGRQLYLFQGHEDVTAEDLACSVRFSDNNNSVMDYMLSPLVTAMYNGGICFIDEIGKIRPRALALLVSVLDERRYIDSTLLGERIYAHPAFRFVAATNTTDINLLPEFIISRMRPQIKLDYPSREEIDNIIRNQCAGMKKEVDRLIDLFWVLCSESNNIGTIAPRDAIYLFGWAAKLSEFEASGGSKALEEAHIDHPYLLQKEQSYTGIKPEHLKQAFHKLFNNGSSR